MQGGREGGREGGGREGREGGREGGQRGVGVSGGAQGVPLHPGGPGREGRPAQCKEGEQSVPTARLAGSSRAPGLCSVTSDWCLRFTTRAWCLVTCDCDWRSQAGGPDLGGDAESGAPLPRPCSPVVLPGRGVVAQNHCLHRHPVLERPTAHTERTANALPKAHGSRMQ